MGQDKSVMKIKECPACGGKPPKYIETDTEECECECGARWGVIRCAPMPDYVREMLERGEE